MKASESPYCRCMYFASQALARKVEKLAYKAWEKVNLPPSHGYLLMLVIENPGMQPSELVEQLLLTPSTITRLVEKLETKKLVVRTHEGKETNIYPSPKGKELYPKLKECLSAFYGIYSGILGKEESARLVNQMNRVSDKLE